MADLELRLDLDEVIGAHETMIAQSRELMEKAVQSLAVQAHAHVVEEAQKKLHSRRQMFLDNLRLEQIDKNLWSVVVGEKAVWIEDGQSAHNMLHDLLSSPKAKTNKKGGKYLVVPFSHSKGGPSSQTPFQQSLVAAVKSALQMQRIPYKGIERHQDGSPKLGLLHRFDLNRPTPKQPHHSVPLLFGISVYQRLNRSADGSVKMTKGGKESVSRDIMTFRVASSSAAGTGAWEHPGNAPMNFLDSARDWAENLWETQIKPQIVSE